MQLEASRAASGVDVAGSNLIASERTIDALYTLRRDFEQDGQVPWPLAIDEPWDVVVDPGVGRRSADWPAVRAFIRRWYSAAVATLQYRVELRLAPALVARGLARFPDDPTLLVARGSLVETSLALAQVDDSLAATLYSVETRQRWRDELANAERDFERAERAGDRSTEAGVRLARVRLLTGERESARATLDRVLAAAAPVVVRYLALLFRAAAAEQAGDARAAIQDYDAAADIWPGAQTPLLALGRIADESHRPADARNYVQRALAAKAGSGDPWRGYILGQAWQLDARLASLRTLEPH
jgi:tetratricopeptide (TPR) repeat protein